MLIIRSLWPSSRCNSMVHSKASWIFRSYLVSATVVPVVLLMVCNTVLAQSFTLGSFPEGFLCWDCPPGYVLADSGGDNFLCYPADGGGPSDQAHVDKAPFHQAGVEQTDRGGRSHGVRFW